MDADKYIMSFSTGGLFYRESVKLASLYLERKDWKKLRSKVLESNLLQARTSKSAERVYREASARLQTLTDEQMAILADGTRDEQNQILWLAICKRFRFIREFAIEVLREKFLRLELEITYEDYQVFFNAKAEWHDDLENLSETTRKKIRQVLFKMMREAELITKDNVIIPATLSPRVASAIADDPRASMAIYPTAESINGGGSAIRT